MGLSRRRFLCMGGSAATLAAVPNSVPALSDSGWLHPADGWSQLDDRTSNGPMKITVGDAAITWGDELDQAIEDISSLGYAGIQFRANVVKLIPDPSVVKSKLEQHHLRFAALSSGDLVLDLAQEEANLALHEQHAQYLQAGGGHLLQVLGTFRKDGQFTEEEYRRTGQLLTEVGKRASKYGVQVGFHNHMGSIAQSPAQLQKILDAADPHYVKLLLDVAHCHAGGGDPAAAVHKYADRLLFVHFKDVKRISTPPGYQFVELGEGEVNLPDVVAALRQIHYRGWAIVEFDSEAPGSTRTPKQSAAICRDYIEHTLQIRV
jgi:inosose dehydratase